MAVAVAAPMRRLRQTSDLASLEMQRAMAKQAESEREKQAKIIHASGELEASKQLTEAAHTLQSQPVALHLRYLQTLVEIAAEKNSTLIFPVPIDWMRALVGWTRNSSCN
jgi:regulator of protease activity HflC (stomatin/prohibitin superfamily)